MVKIISQSDFEKLKWDELYGLFARCVELSRNADDHATQALLEIRSLRSGEIDE